MLASCDAAFSPYSCSLLVGSVSTVANARAASQPVARTCAEDAQALKSFASQQPPHSTLHATALRLAASYEQRRNDCGLTVHIQTRGDAAVIGLAIGKRISTGAPSTIGVLGIVGAVLAALALTYYDRRHPHQATTGA
jgi:hypothetical protein